MLLLVGVVTLVFYTINERSSRRQPWWPILFRVALTLLLYLANLPAAAACIYVAVQTVTGYSVKVHNDSPIAVDHFILDGPGVHQDLGPVPPASKGLTTVKFAGDGALTARVEQSTGIQTLTLEGYVTGDMGGRCTVTILPGNTSRVDH